MSPLAGGACATEHGAGTDQEPELVPATGTRLVDVQGLVGGEQVDDEVGHHVDAVHQPLPPLHGACSDVRHEATLPEEADDRQPDQGGDDGDDGDDGNDGAGVALAHCSSFREATIRVGLLGFSIL